MENTAAQKYRNYITGETEDAMRYHKLAQIAPDEDDRKLLLESANDETRHSDTFSWLYKELTGDRFEPKIEAIELKKNYYDTLRDVLLDEGEAYKRYGLQQIAVDNDRKFRAIYSNAMNDENVHANRVTYMLSKEKH